jgi:predicted TIM-barrel fold metal-dependent hydrolase
MSTEAAIPVCNPPDREPRRPTMTVPAGSTDCHVHVFGPADRYPYSPQRGYTPPDSTADDLRFLHAQLGIDRVVLTQPSVYGTDNSAILDAVAGMPGRARAIVAVPPGVTDGDLAVLHAAGARGIRLNLDNQGGMPMPLEAVPEIARRIAGLGWHLEFLFPGADLVDLAWLLSSLPVPASVAHFSYMPLDVSYPPFQLLLDLVAEGNLWVKLSAPNRVSATDLPPYDDVAPLVHALIEANRDVLVWATDWPHPNRYGDTPNDADLLDAFGEWVTDVELRNKILVDNPARLYGF